MSFENFPYSNFHELNLDWIVQKIKEAYSSENPPDYPVKSVNGQTGDVIIAIPSNFVQSVNGETGDVVLYRNPLTQFPATDEVRWNLFRICDGTEKGIEFDADSAKRIAGTRRILIYDEDNPPDYPVTSVNGQTGDVQITAGVQSVNGKTGNVVTPFVNPNTDILALDSDSPSILWGFSRNVEGGNVALYITTGGTNPQAFIRYIPDGGQAINLPLLTNADIPESAGVVSVNTKTGAVTLYGTDILTNNNTNNTIATDINNALNTGLKNSNSIILLDDCILLQDSGNTFTWLRGVYTAIAGAFSGASRFICSETYINDKYVRAKCPENMRILIQAWDESDNYIGIYNPNNSQFETYDTLPTNLFKNEINIIAINKNYPTYKLKITARYNNGDNIELSASTNVTFDYVATLDTSSLEQQITALQNADTAHDQQITALQNASNSYSQQITALQNADTAHDQQITALQNTSNSYSQQIAELYTKVGTGIKEVKFTDVVSLPIRYPETGTDADITENMACVNAILSRPGVQRTNLTIVFYNGYFTISGTIQGMTDIILYLTKT